MEDLELLASGNEAGVYAIDDRRVLRRHRRVADVRGEAALMAYVAAGGFPVPEVFAVNGADLDTARSAVRVWMRQLDLSGPAELAAAVARVRGVN